VVRGFDTPKRGGTSQDPGRCSSPSVVPALCCPSEESGTIRLDSEPQAIGTADGGGADSRSSPDHHLRGPRLHVSRWGVLRSPLSMSHLTRRRRVAITGLGVIAPNGIGKDEFWRSLVAGRSAVDFISSFDPSPYPCKIAAEVKSFVPRDFLSNRIAKNAARFSQFAIAASRLAVADSKLSISASLASETAICYGASVNGIGELYRGAGNGVMKPWVALEYPSHAASSYLAIEFGITGRALSVSSNCCTGIDAIHTAAAYIAAGKARVALAGACDAPLFPLSFAAFCALGALSRRTEEPHRASRPYDLMRDGIVLGEGAATVVLEDLEGALDRGATVYAEVLGHAAASEAIGMRKGDIEGQVMAHTLTAAIADAELAPSDIDHINAHGTSLPDYDTCDTNAFKKALGRHAYSIPVVSIKSMIGQPVSAAGALQTVCACLSIAHQVAPPTINQDVPDPQCDLDYVPNRSRAARIRNVLINGHSFGGSVSALVIGQPATTTR
jgi:3-oxoacyl-[acyl-carrier-protein] synthase II